MLNVMVNLLKQNKIKLEKTTPSPDSKRQLNRT